MGKTDIGKKRPNGKDEEARDDMGWTADERAALKWCWDRHASVGYMAIHCDKSHFDVHRQLARMNLRMDKRRVHLYRGDHPRANQQNRLDEPLHGDNVRAVEEAAAGQALAGYGSFRIMRIEDLSEADRKAMEALHNGG